MRAPELDRLIADFGQFPDDLRKELRPAMRRAAEPILRDAKRRASWSSRIPGAIRLVASFTKRSPGVRLRVDLKKAPHARAFEGLTSGATFRHRVYGRDVWVTQRARPFFFPAVQAGSEAVMAEANAAVLAAARSAGFK